jgi:hypothetical protein
MKAFKVTTKTQAFVVTAETMAAVCSAYSDCDDLESIFFLGEVVAGIRGNHGTDAGFEEWKPLDGPITEAAELERAFRIIILFAETKEHGVYPHLHRMLTDQRKHLKDRGVI